MWNKSGDSMQIPKPVWDHILLHLKSELPREGCGALIGSVSAVRYRRLRNLARDEAHFRAEPQEWVTLLHDLEKSGERLLAIVHSHPSSLPVPSREDTDNFWYPDACMLIVSLRNPDRPEARLYAKKGQRFECRTFEIARG